MRELTTQTGIVVKCSKTAIEFFQNAQSVDFFSVLEIPEEFQGIAVEFYDLIMENAVFVRVASHKFHFRHSDLLWVGDPQARLSCCPKARQGKNLAIVNYCLVLPHFS